MNEAKEFLFDVNVVASVRVKAKNSQEALNLLRNHLNGASIDFAGLVSGTIALRDVPEFHLLEIDGCKV